MLYDAGRHAALLAHPWTPERARSVVGRIIETTAGAFDPVRLWPRHPEETDPDDPDAAGLHGLYFGAAGVVSALDWLERQGLGASGLDFAAIMASVLRAYDAEPDSSEVPVPSYSFGASGILLTSWRLAPDRALADRLWREIMSNIDNPAIEVMWGAPGTLLAAATMARWTQEPRWGEAVRASAAALWASWDAAKDDGFLWEQDLYGNRFRYLGAAHGFVGNVQALMVARAVAGIGDLDALAARAEAVLTTFARREGDLVNWPSRRCSDPAKPLKVQWCHGAPGIVLGLAALPAGCSPTIDALLLEAGELTWRAGPIAEDAGLCHGTAGNGAAFLALARRTGDGRWLARARAFAMHAIAQHESRLAAGGPAWHSLFTGDLGLAIYLERCLAGEPGVLTIDLM
jgi:hypothetical protein